MEIFRTALRSLLSNRTRSILTMLGIIIGVGAVITMVAIGNGASNQMQELIAGFGSNLIIVSPAPPNTTGARVCVIGNTVAKELFGYTNPNTNNSCRYR